MHRIPKTARIALVALALTIPALWAGALFAGASYVRSHGGLAASMTDAARSLAAHEGVRGATRARCPYATFVSSSKSTSSSFSWSSDDSDGFSFSLLEPGEHGSIMLDAPGHGGTLRRLGEGEKTPVAWFSRDGEEYLVRDPALVAEARRITAPLRELGERMGKLGAEMGRHGAEMGRFGGRMGAIGGRLGALSARAALDRSRDVAESVRVQAEVNALQAEMAQLQAEMARLEAARGGQARQSELSREMSELSGRHKEIGTQVRRELRELLERALREGKAERLHADA